ncbi:conserved hypothetical protein [Histoplasma capsulatum G186AR]|uniref:Uncharacterized protein n=2 Tax=Ajellomyces capsulatus TaxID=5037 RepID=C0NID6_AJECG|nr:uncharacterized protein HCBG_02193 [Histoplasma capsulatum G186AR]EEH08656.1 conserved hypothetical protein [Histoplasma capsulatum G186AR]KAG5304033.1 hypothetical protein I7I52_02224 [Histoplasma capsulatum]QSS69632.1 hypothetical protein I7I50_10986 [Histoplasma capsulatum G186AR]
MTSVNLRRTFRYPDSESEHETRGELDEEEQEAMIQKLLRQDEERNAQYTLIFTALPLASILLYLPYIFYSTSTGSQRLLCILSIASLLSTAYIMKYIRLGRPDPEDELPRRDTGAEQWPMTLRQYLVAANTVICATLSVVAFSTENNSHNGDVFWALYLVPGSVFILIWGSRKIMMSIDIKELEYLRYEYKGA